MLHNIDLQIDETVLTFYYHLNLFLFISDHKHTLNAHCVRVSVFTQLIIVQTSSEIYAT